MDIETINKIISIGKGLNVTIELEPFLSNLPALSGSEPIFKISWANTYKYLNNDIEHLIKGLHLIEENYKREYKNNFGFGSSSPSFKLISKLAKTDLDKAIELEFWIANNGENYYIKPCKNYSDFKTKLTKLHIKKSFNYYFAIFDKKEIKDLIANNEEIFNGFVECILPKKEYLEYYFRQANCNVLPNGNGILLMQDMFKILCNKSLLLNDYETFYFYQLYNTINDQNRYKKEYSPYYDLDKLNKCYNLKEQVLSEKTEWKNILINNPDLFIFKNNNKVLVASKDYKLLQNIKL